jgi:flagellar biosynthesis protein FlhA
MSKVAVPIGVVSIVLMLVVPLPAAIIDVLLGFNITCSLLILLVAMQIKKPLDFAVFPALILIATLFRLALNVSSTRLVLTDGFAGKVIEAFGHFVIGGSLIVGLVIFVILTIIQFVVITNGSTRRRPASAAPRSPPRPTSTGRWTVPRSSSRATPSPASSSR